MAPTAMDRPSPLPSPLATAAEQPVSHKTVQGPQALPASLGDTRLPRRKRRWLSWLGVATMGCVAAGSGVLSANLHDHAGERRQLMDEITQLEVEATELSMTVWRALTMMMAEDKMQFIRLRGQTGEQRAEIMGRMERIAALDQAGEEYNSLLGFDAQPELLEGVDNSTRSFLGNIQGTLSQMSMATDRTRERLRYWDMNFGPFIESLQELKGRNGEIADSSALVAKRVATAAGLSRLLASVLLVLTFSRQRTGRRRRVGDLLPPGSRRSTDRLPSQQGVEPDGSDHGVDGHAHEEGAAEEEALTSSLQEAG